MAVDPDKSHPATAVEPWLAPPPRRPRLVWPTDGPHAHPLERACGAVHDGGTRPHRRTRLPALVADGAEQLHRHGPWKSQRADLDHEPAVTAAVEQIAAEERAQAAA